MPQFKIALTNVEFDNTYENTIYFSTRQEQQTYFNVATLFNNSPDVNFDIGSIIETNVTINTNSLNILELGNYNYAILKDTQSVNPTIEYYYYFINNVTYLANRQAIFTLELDVMQTYYIDIEFQDCIIRRAHLNRFTIKNNKAIFNLNDTSYLFAREPIGELNKRLVTREPITFKIFDSDVLNNWIKDNVIAWVYVYRTPLIVQQPSPIPNIDYRINFVSEGARSTMRGNYSVYCYPLMRTGKEINIVDGINTYNWQQGANEDDTLTISKKITTYPPLNSFIDTPDYAYIDNSGKMIIEAVNSSINYDNLLVNPSGEIFLINTAGLNTYQYCDYTFNKVYAWNVSIFTPNLLHQATLNPKLLSSDYTSYKLTNGIDSFEYDMLKLGSPTHRIAVNEAYTPDISRQYARIIPTPLYEGISEGLYNEQTAKNYTGLVTSQDTTFPYSVNKLEEFMANNKNYYMQRGVSITNQLANLGTNPIKSGLGLISQEINQSLTIDNLRNAPETMQNVNGNPFLNLSVDKIGYFIEQWACLYSEKLVADDFMNRYGYSYNRLGNIKEFDSKRYIFNYVQADIENFNLEATKPPQVVRDKIKEIFANGVRLWKHNSTHLWSYDYENYESYFNE